MRKRERERERKKEREREREREGVMGNKESGSIMWYKERYKNIDIL